MPKKRFSAEQIVVVLRQIEVLMSQVKTARWLAGKPGFRSRVIIADGKNTADLSLIGRSEERPGAGERP